MMSMHGKTMTELSDGLRRKEFSAVELARHYLGRIATANEQLNAVVTVTEESAMDSAKRADERIAKGDAGPLIGIPLLHKDIFCTDGVRTACGSKMLDAFVAPYNATVVSRLDNAGMVMLGKTNMDEFAMGSSNETSYYGPVKNPWDLERVPGGSSGGSAAAMAARLAPGLTGTDTGGSIRQPAALCGVTGLKPTYGRVSRYGMIAFASSLDQAGTFTVDAQDAALMLGAMAGFDERDSTSIDKSVPDYTSTLNDSIEGLRIGIPEEFFKQGLDSNIESIVRAALAQLESMGAVLKAISLPNTHASVPTYYVVAPAECSSNLSRMDGARFGYRCDNPKDLADMYARSRGEGFGEEVKRRIMIGTYALSAGYYDAYYLKAQKVRRVIADDFRQAFSEVDVIAGPVTPETAFRLGEKSDDPVNMYLSDIFTMFDESRLLNVAHQYQQVTDWHRQMPEQFQ